MFAFPFARQGAFPKWTKLIFCLVFWPEGFGVNGQSTRHLIWFLELLFLFLALSLQYLR